MAEDSNKNKSKKQKHFFKDMKTELKKVTWLTPKQLTNNTIAVISMVIIVATIVFVLDFAFENASNYGIGGLKSLIHSESIENTVSDGSDEENTVSDDNQVEEENTVSENEDENTETENGEEQE